MQKNYELFSRYSSKLNSDLYLCTSKGIYETETHIYYLSQDLKVVAIETSPPFSERQISESEDYETLDYVFHGQHLILLTKQGEVADPVNYNSCYPEKTLDYFGCIVKADDNLVVSGWSEDNKVNKFFLLSPDLSILDSHAVMCQVPSKILIII